MNGWFKFHRTMLEHAVWSLSDGQRIVWLTCLAMANIKPGEWWDGRQRVEIPPGAFITSRAHLAKAAKVSVKTARLALTNLERIGSIRAKTGAKQWTLIEVVNWPTWQGGEDIEGQEEGLRGAHEGPTRGHNGRRKEGEKEDLAGDGAPAGASNGKGHGEGKAKRRTSTPPNPEVKTVVDAYFTTYRDRFGSPPPVNGRHGRLAQELLRGRPLDEALWIVLEATSTISAGCGRWVSLSTRLPDTPLPRQSCFSVDDGHNDHRARLQKSETEPALRPCASR